ncbi:hypothetical protein BATDEDRAFT_22113 [Batrachochytrium dendrobatidis JAM81]|uniref:Uncharacterized protein n=2 Tax=Batrachochytrium dendrobatidis TaxID=109871 RepID=F4NSF4_BATDJ|nr:uncharacterized protein BATDEDRAFT_22113 [Batrachochytrium dendrobatidis JAM81]EGF83424.1 hypothetical protein BATDEDRAFT_22113 [Batrachochytrium dendrobatidis JAM81]|eukprot:XP_006675472.1 hypothetical protein BATDEDRAFT_22113 [Batrachochytrium dendrobatidis JAM81]
MTDKVPCEGSDTQKTRSWSNLLPFEHPSKALAASIAENEAQQSHQIQSSSITSSIQSQSICIGQAFLDSIAENTLDPLLHNCELNIANETKNKGAQSISDMYAVECDSVSKQDESLAQESPYESKIDLNSSYINRRRSRRPSNIEFLPQTLVNHLANPKPAAFHRRLSSQYSSETGAKPITSEQFFTQSIYTIGKKMTPSLPEIEAPSNGLIPFEKSSEMSAIQSRRTSLITVHEILTSNHTRGYKSNTSGKMCSEIATQTDENIVGFDALDQLFFALRDEFHTTEERMQVSQRQNIRVATDNIHNRIQSQIIGMKDAYDFALNKVRHQCQKLLQEALVKIRKDNERYDAWLLSEIEQKHTQIYTPLKLVADVASEQLRKTEEELQRLKYTAFRLTTALGHHGLLSEEEMKVSKEECKWAENLIAWYQDEVSERDETIQKLCYEISNLDFMHDDFDKSIKRAKSHEQKNTLQDSTTLNQTYTKFNSGNQYSKQATPASIVSIETFMEAINYADDPTIDMQTSNDLDSSQSATADSDLLAVKQLTESYLLQIQDIEKKHALEIANLLKYRERLAFQWSIKIKSAEKFTNNNAILKIMHRQERLVRLAQMQNKPRRSVELGLTTHLEGATLAMILENKKLIYLKHEAMEMEQEKDTETQKQIQTNLQQKMKDAHQEIRQIHSKKSKELNRILERRSLSTKVFSSILARQLDQSSQFAIPKSNTMDHLSNFSTNSTSSFQNCLKDQSSMLCNTYPDLKCSSSICTDNSDDRTSALHSNVTPSVNTEVPSDFTYKGFKMNPCENTKTQHTVSLNSRKSSSSHTLSKPSNGLSTINKLVSGPSIKTVYENSELQGLIGVKSVVSCDRQQKVSSLGMDASHKKYMAHGENRLKLNQFKSAVVEGSGSMKATSHPKNNTFISSRLACTQLTYQPEKNSNLSVSECDEKHIKADTSRSILHQNKHTSHAVSTPRERSQLMHRITNRNSSHARVDTT